MGRIVGYSYDGDFDETAMEKVLDHAKQRGVVGQFDTGRGNTVWFEGPPGADMRAVRKAVLALMPKGTKGVAR